MLTSGADTADTTQPEMPERARLSASKTHENTTLSRA